LARLSRRASLLASSRLALEAARESIPLVAYRIEASSDRSDSLREIPAASSEASSLVNSDSNSSAIESSSLEALESAAEGELGLGRAGPGPGEGGSEAAAGEAVGEEGSACAQSGGDKQSASAMKQAARIHGIPAPRRAPRSIELSAMVRVPPVSARVIGYSGQFSPEAAKAEAALLGT
jgi:hypothetical protein